MPSSISPSCAWLGSKQSFCPLPPPPLAPPPLLAFFSASASAVAVADSAPLFFFLGDRAAARVRSACAHMCKCTGSVIVCESRFRKATKRGGTKRVACTSSTFQLGIKQWAL